MDIMELGAIGELVGGVAVIASLIYVGLQVRQSTIATQVGYQRSSTNAWTTVMRTVDRTRARRASRRRWWCWTMALTR